MRPARAVVAGAVLLGALVSSSGSAFASDALAAREQLKIGYLLAQEGKCQEALPHLRESLRLDRRAITLINLAQCEEQVGQLADAMSHWVDAHARAEAEGSKEIQDEADRRAAALEPRLPKLTIVLAEGAPKDVVVLRDGAVLGAASIGVPLPVNPGTHTIVVRAPGRTDMTTEVRLGEAQSERVEVRVGDVDPRSVSAAHTVDAIREAAPPAPPETTRTSPLVWVGFGVAVPALVVGSVTGLLAAGAASDAKRDCPAGACKDQDALDAVESGKLMGTISTVAFVVGAAGVGLGVYGLLSPKKTAASTPVGVRLAPARLIVEGTF